jgi:hypothetical protein
VIFWGNLSGTLTFACNQFPGIHSRGQAAISVYFLAPRIKDGIFSRPPTKHYFVFIDIAGGAADPPESSLNHNFIYATDDVPVVDRERGFYRCTVTRSTDLMSTSCRCFLTTFVYKTSETKFIRCTLFSVCPTSSHTVIYKCRFV